MRGFGFFLAGYLAELDLGFIGFVEGLGCYVRVGCLRTGSVLCFVFSLRNGFGLRL